MPSGICRTRARRHVRRVFFLLSGRGANPSLFAQQKSIGKFVIILAMAAIGLNNGVSGHAGIFADAAAYEALLLLYLNTTSPLLISSLEEHAPTRGLGWQKSDLYPFGCGHTGFTGTSVYLSKEKNIGCVLLTNRLFYPDRNTHLTHDARRALHTLLADHFS